MTRPSATRGIAGAEPRIDISGLPQFTVGNVRAAIVDNDAVVIGHFSHLHGVRNDGGWLYRSPGPSIVGGLSCVPTAAGEYVEFRTPDLALAAELHAGAVYPWVDIYWQAYHVDMILAGRWDARIMSAAPARYFQLDGVTGWQPEDAPLPHGAQDLGVRAGGWDHENCELCQVRIGEPVDPHGYVDEDNHWLCTTCYHRYAMTHDLSFAVGI
ncbi:MAG: hypothetical protein ABI035_12845 [Gemmatimonadaceae bacterium]